MVIMGRDRWTGSFTASAPCSYANSILLPSLHLAWGLDGWEGGIFNCFSLAQPMPSGI